MMKQAKLLSNAEFKRLTAVINSIRYSERNHTIVALSFYAGMRACEIAALRVCDVINSDGKVNDTIYLNAAQTKGSENTTILVNTKLQKQLYKYLKIHTELLEKPNRALIFSAKGAGFSAQTIVNLFKRLYGLAGIEGASSHSGRRQFVTRLADQGINARLVQSLARHKHLSTTQRYIDVNENALRNALEVAIS
jgi:integrase/recombinase XerD